jgi:hypothetical protein
MKSIQNRNLILQKSAFVQLFGQLLYAWSFTMPRYLYMLKLSWGFSRSFHSLNARFFSTPSITNFPLKILHRMLWISWEGKNFESVNSTILTANHPSILLFRAQRQTFRFTAGYYQCPNGSGLSVVKYLDYLEYFCESIGQNQWNQLSLYETLR